MAEEIKLKYDEISHPEETQRDIREISGFIKTITAYPTHIPKKISEQIVLYISGSAKQLCVYDTINNDWICFEHTDVSPSSSLSPSASPSVSPSSSISPSISPSVSPS